jgi:hypothetical protein
MDRFCFRVRNGRFYLEDKVRGTLQEATLQQIEDVLDWQENQKRLKKRRRWFGRKLC